MKHDTTTPLTLIVPPKNLTMDKLVSEGVPCFYARFERAAPTRQDGAPVNEMYTNHPDIKTRGSKYLVDQIVYTPQGVIVIAHGKTIIIPIGNLDYVRPI
jgi:hypothetical protein